MNLHKTRTRTKRLNVETRRRVRKAASGGAVSATRGVTRRAPHADSSEERARPGQEFTIDLRLYTEVLWRHRLLVGVGLAVALALAFLSVVRVSSDGLAYRKSETWSTASVLVLSQASFPEGSSALPPDSDPNRFATIVDQYAALATSDEVIASLKRQGLLKPDAGAISELPIAATAVPSAVTGAVTPLLELTAVGESPDAATRLVVRTTDTFINVVKSRQQDAGIPQDQRVRLEIVTRAGVPELIGPRKKTTPIFIFLAGLTIVVAAAFIRDNMQRDDDAKRGVPPYQLEAAPVLDPVLDPLETPEADATAPDPVLRGDQAARPAGADPADVSSVTIPRRSSGSTR
jgi:capsular polysaccharide biosynthesis protein